MATPKSPELLHFLRLTTAERRALLEPPAAPPPAPVVDITTGKPAEFSPRPYRRRPRPGKAFRKLTEDEKVALLGRESGDCGPGTILVRVRAIIEARNAGDPRSLAGSLEDLAAAALSYAERTIEDMQNPPK